MNILTPLKTSWYISEIKGDRSVVVNKRSPQPIKVFPMINNTCASCPYFQDYSDRGRGLCLLSETDLIVMSHHKQCQEVNPVDDYLFYDDPVFDERGTGRILVTA